MKTNRPRISVPYEPMDIIVDLISVSLLILMMSYTVLSYSELPDVIPSHFNAQGDVDGHSKKLFIWFLPVIGIVTFTGLFILNKYPHIHNYMVNITEANALKNYRFSTRIVRFTNLFVILVLGFTNYAMIEGAKGDKVSLGSWFTPVVIGLSLLLPVIILIYNNKINKS